MVQEHIPYGAQYHRANCVSLSTHHRSPAEGTQSRDMAAMDELDEIGANLSDSPSIPDCKILVRRARNAEPMLLSYIVAQVAA